MQVTEEDGGRLNAFAKEPRMEVMEVGESSSANSKLLLIGGAVLVLLLVGVPAFTLINRRSELAAERPLKSHDMAA